MIDAHAHIHEINFPFKWSEMIGRAHINGVYRIITVGTTLEDSKAAIKFAEQHDDIFALIGIHPNEAVDGDVDDFAKIIQNHPKVVGFGDIGLDYHYKDSNNTPEKQKELLRWQLNLAIKYNLPVSFHVRDAYSDFWQLFDEFNGKIQGVLHSFTDSEENLQEGLKRGLFIGVNGIVTFVQDLSEIISKCPLDRVILETDSPFLTPIPFRGQKNQPANVLEVAKTLAKIHKVALIDVDKITTDNTKRLFSIPSA